jgi:hypothetical protein
MPVFGLDQIVMLYCYTGPSLIGFNLASVMATQAYLSVRMTAIEANLNSFPAFVIFDQVASASEHFWDPTNNAITITYAGAYFISLTIEIPPYMVARVMITANQVPRALLSIVDLNKTENWPIKNGIMSGRSACMLQLNAGVVLTSSVDIRGTDIYGSEDGISNMQAFLYSPQSAIGTPVAWSVASAITVVTYQPPSYIVGYDLIQVNIGYAWNPSSNSSIIPVSGTYLIDVTSCLGRTSSICSNENSGNHGN